MPRIKKKRRKTRKSSPKGERTGYLGQMQSTSPKEIPSLGSTRNKKHEEIELWNLSLFKKILVEDVMQICPDKKRQDRQNRMNEDILNPIDEMKTIKGNQ